MIDFPITVEKPFFIFFPERSGSTLLVHLLNAHPDVDCREEVFSIDHSDGYEKPKLTDQEKKSQLLESIYGGSQAAVASGFKFKFSVQYMHYPDVYRFLLKNVNSVRMIFLYRENLLKMAISRQNLMRMREMGEKYFLHRDSKTDVGKIVLDLPKAEEFVLRQKNDLHFFRRASKIFLHRLEVTYEELNQDASKTIDEVYRFLGLKTPESELQPPIKKITKDSFEDAVENYQEMVDYFSDTPYAEFLQE